MKFAYADPPYLGLSAQFYSEHPDAADYDRPETHQALIDRLCNNFDAWALSLHSPSLRVILPMCPDDVRVASWTKGFASFKPGVNPAYAWEPVIFWGARKKRSRKERTVRDWCNVSITLKRGFTGAKPAEFCWWIFELLGMQLEDEFTDVFPGSGAVGLAYEKWRRVHEGFSLFV